MRPIWTGWVTYGSNAVMARPLQYASIYGIPPHRRTLMVKRDCFLLAQDDRPTERFFVALPALYFLILRNYRRHNSYKELFVFTEKPGWKPAAGEERNPLHLFPWPNRIGRGAICLGCNIAAMTNSDIINYFFISPFTESFLLTNVQFRIGEKKIQTVRTFQEWQTLSQKYPDLGSHIVLESIPWARCLNLRRAPKFTYGQTVRRKNSRYPGRIQMIATEGESYRYLIIRRRTNVSALESEIVQMSPPMPTKRVK